jgi:RNA 2',3'-cyclic 3'-phosphodiesterase
MKGDKALRKTHYFIAIPVSTEVSERLEQFQNELKEFFSFRTWVHKQDYHITLAFLGHATPDQIDQVKREMKKIANAHHSFWLTLDKISTFGNRFAPRILWQGVKEEPRLQKLRQDVYSACMDIGFSLDQRPFAPHITMARKWQGEHEFDIAKLNEVFENKEENERFLVERMVLYQTHLDRTPKYEPLFVFPLLSQ